MIYVTLTISCNVCLLKKYIKFKPCIAKTLTISSKNIFTYTRALHQIEWGTQI